MNPTPEAILKRYWGYDQFRSPQRAVIEALLEGKDALAVLPTGGGKSLCFQLPTLLVEGLCAVVTPLIALMNDQVEQLRQRGVAALALHSGMSRREVENALDRCIYDRSMRFLYLSPERIQTSLFAARAERLPITLIAVDEAHCISEWGHDFRPSYRKISQLRDLKPTVPCIALTATATPTVQSDIAAQLRLQSPAIFQKSFARTNLSLTAACLESPERNALRLLLTETGSSLVYLRSRQRTEQVAQWLQKQGLPTAWYHAGMSYAERAQQRTAWERRTTPAMTATSAFGMGINKADVRVVVHLDLPEGLEAYYQEAGRAGRDGLPAKAALLYGPQAIQALRERTAQTFPAADELRQIYQALANYYSLAVGSGEGAVFYFDIRAFCERFRKRQALVHHALKRLEEQGLIALSDGFFNPSRIHFLTHPEGLYAAQVADPSCDALIKTLMRLYGAEAFSGFVSLSERGLADRLRWSEAEVKSTLNRLRELELLAYEEASDQPTITWTTARQEASRLTLDLRMLNAQRERAQERTEALILYATQQRLCRMAFIQEYFGERDAARCGRCDVCVAQLSAGQEAYEAENYRMKIMALLEKGPLTLDELEAAIAPPRAGALAEAVRSMLDQGEARYDEALRLCRGPQRN